MEEALFSWDDAKAAANRKLGRPSFEQAKLIFRDTLAVELGEDRRGYDEYRYNIIGRSGADLLHVTYTERGDRIHIISVRLAMKHERDFWLNKNPPEFF